MLVVLLALVVAALAFSARSAHAQAIGSGDTVVPEAGYSWIGVPYVYNGVDSFGVDCSGFTMLVFQQFGVSLPDSPGGQYEYGTLVSGAPAAGDLVFFSEDGSGALTHVGIATGAGTMIHASDYWGLVTETPIDNIPGYVGAKRIL